MQRKPKNVRINGRGSFLIEVKDRREALYLMALKSTINLNVIITEFLMDFDIFKKGLMKNKQIREAVSATWIKS